MATTSAKDAVDDPLTDEEWGILAAYKFVHKVRLTSKNTKVLRRLIATARDEPGVRVALEARRQQQRHERLERSGLRVVE